MIKFCSLRLIFRRMRCVPCDRVALPFRMHTQTGRVASLNDPLAVAIFGLWLGLQAVLFSVGRALFSADWMVIGPTRRKPI